MLKNTPDKYGAVTKALHWVTAPLILGMLGVGLYMTGLDDLGQKLVLYPLHKSVGVCVLVLVLLRIVWHLYSKKPPLPASLKAWEKAAALAVHLLLYVCLVGMPLSGWLLSSAAGRTVSVFNMFKLPDLVGQNENLADIFGETHEILGWTLIGLIIVHVFGALKHRFIDKDKTLQRMLPFSGKG